MCLPTIYVFLNCDFVRKWYKNKTNTLARIEKREDAMHKRVHSSSKIPL